MTTQNDQEKVIAFLRDPNNYHHASHNMAIAETNQSLVFLVGDYAYKLFKSIARYRDNTTPEARLENAQLEMAANKPLAGDLYKEILAVIELHDGKLALVGLEGTSHGQVLDYVVMMHRFDDEALMYTRLFNDTLTKADLYALGRHVANFHNNQPTQAPENGGYLAFRHEYLLHWITSFAEKMHCPHGQRMLLDMLTPGLRATDAAKHAFEARTNQWCALHGDMDYGNIATFKGKLLPFDAQVLFGQRSEDPAKDVAYTLAPLYMYGRADLAKSLVDGYKSIIADDTLDQVLPLWVAYAAIVRGSSWLGKSQTVTDPNEAAKYEAFGYRYLQVASRLLKGELSL